MPYSEKERARWRKYYIDHKDEIRIKQAERYKNGKYGEYFETNKDRLKDQFLQRTYGISLADYDEMLAQQNYGCALCGRPPTTKRRLAVDHDHDTGRVRGLLCDRCNGALGNLGDSAARIQNAADYVAGKGAWKR